ncbi:MAG: ABC transporter ATP-binding protein, partial [Putridiphycobacter sp.]
MFGKKEKKEKVKLSKASYKKASKFFVYMKPYLGIYSIGWLFLLLSSVTAMLFPLLMGKLLGTNNLAKSPLQSPFSDSFDFSNLDVSSIFMILIFVFALQAFFSFFRILLFS